MIVDVKEADTDSDIEFEGVRDGDPDGLTGVGVGVDEAEFVTDADAELVADAAHNNRGGGDLRGQQAR